jgi:hypothetical protein
MAAAPTSAAQTPTPVARDLANRARITRAFYDDKNTYRPQDRVTPAGFSPQIAKEGCAAG